MSADHYDAVIVGSGFGGSVAAERLARGGKRVCVLERGRAYPPGSFPRRPLEMRTNLWDPAAGLHGLFNVWSFKGLEALVSSGLGGGSLIYANVLIRKDERWFVKDAPVGDGVEHWPIDRADLDPHYDRVERMLGATAYPYPDTPKTVAMRDAAARLGLEWSLPNLAVTFAGADGIPAPGVTVANLDFPNLHGLPRRTCRLCGECDIGCNDGAKNTLDHTYLSAAAAAGAEIRTRCEVRRIRPEDSGGFGIDYAAYGSEHDGQQTKIGKLPHVTVTADRLILAAGAVATPYLLLRNRANFPGLGPALGTRFSGNGDFLALALRAKENGSPRLLDATRGPVITSAIRVPDALDGGDGRGFYVEDAGFPAFVEWVLETQATPSTLRRLAGFGWRHLKARVTRRPDSDLSAEFTHVLGDALLSSTSAPLLGMGRDIPDGRLSMRRGHLQVDWTTATSRDFFERMRSTMQDIAGAWGADYQDNLLWLLKRVITVHPLGGAPMGRHVGEAVVDANGESFAYPGLFIVDGAAMPGPVGANPALTIAAFSDLVSELILERAERVAPASPVAPPDVLADEITPDAALAAPSPPDPDAATLLFTEEMKGHVSLGTLAFADGARQGEADYNFLMFRLTIKIHDVARFATDPNREGTATGWVQSEMLGGRLDVESGLFNLFVDASDPEVKHMLYRLWFADAVGNPLTLTGFKTVRDDPGFDTWSDTSTLYVKVLGGHIAPGEDDAADVVATGIITIHLKDFIQQLTTFRVTGPDVAARVGAMKTFGTLFLGELWDVYGVGLARAAGDGDA
ncbi:MAG TPA: GMC family oxidoreductase [Acidimicrobiia bacterium]|nr:GMC family oxidoreductase [Acidimicrobiia bacterium]